MGHFYRHRYTEVDICWPKMANWLKKLNAFTHSIHTLVPCLTDPTRYHGTSKVGLLPALPNQPIHLKPVNLLTLVPPSTCGQRAQQVSAEPHKCNSLPGAREQVISCKCDQRCNMNPHREVSHTVLIQAHTATLQSYALPEQVHTDRSHSQCRIYEFLRMFFPLHSTQLKYFGNHVPYRDDLLSKCRSSEYLSTGPLHKFA